jgi:nitrogen fixation protein NifU and related proteins
VLLVALRVVETRANMMSHGYTSVLMDHFESPRNAGRMSGADGVGEADVAGRAPRITVYLQVRGQRIERASFQSFGCGAAIAAGSVLTEIVHGQTVGQCRALTESDIDSALGGLPANKRFCAALAILALSRALDRVSPSS